MLSHLRRFHSWQVSMLDHFVTLLYVSINNHEPNVHNTTRTFHEQGQKSICNSSEVQLFYHMRKETGDKTINGDNLHGKLGTLLYYCNDLFIILL